MNTRLVASAALSSVLALGLAVPVQAATPAPKEKCYGIANAGANDCANLSGTHSCAGQSKATHALDDWIYVAAGTCAKMGGKTAEEVKAEAAKKP